MDKYAVTVIKKGKVVKYLINGKSGRFAKPVSFFSWELIQPTQKKWNHEKTINDVKNVSSLLLTPSFLLNNYRISGMIIEGHLQWHLNIHVFLFLHLQKNSCSKTYLRGNFDFTTFNFFLKAYPSNLSFLAILQNFLKPFDAKNYC